MTVHAVRWGGSRTPHYLFVRKEKMDTLHSDRAGSGTNKQKTIAAIPTRYKGYRMRSRLEARWAVVFDVMHLAWEYEPQGFELSTGPYLPDFYLPEWKLWVEIKPFWDGTTAEKLSVFCNEIGGILWICGTPGKQDAWLFCYDSWLPRSVRHTVLNVTLTMLGEEEPKLIGDSGWTDEYHSNIERSQPLHCLIFPRFPDEDETERVMAAGRAARFEHGEHGDVR